MRPCSITSIYSQPEGRRRSLRFLQLEKVTLRHLAESPRRDRQKHQRCHLQTRQHTAEGDVFNRFRVPVEVVGDTDQAGAEEEQRTEIDDPGGPCGG